MTLLRLGYLVHSLGNRAMTFFTETDIIPLCLIYEKILINDCFSI